MIDRPPATISPEAEAFLASSDPLSIPSMAETPIAKIRQDNYEACRAASEDAVERFGVAEADTEIGGISCMRVTPSVIHEGRQLLYLFGGGFVQGGPFEDLPIISALAAHTGATVLAPRYRLAPEHPFPAALDDVTTVARSVLADNPGTLLAGESAGGNLALALAHRLRAEDHGVPPAIAVMSPATDLDHIGDSLDIDRDPILKKIRIDEVPEAYLGETNRKQPEVSPIYGRFDPDFPATFITTGTRDLFLSPCTRLARVMREAGATVDLRVWEGMWHVFEYYPGIPEADESLKEIAAFLDTYF